MTTLPGSMDVGYRPVLMSCPVMSCPYNHRHPQTLPFGVHRFSLNNLLDSTQPKKRLWDPLELTIFLAACFYLWTTTVLPQNPKVQGSL